MWKFSELDYWHRSPKRIINANSLLANDVGKKLVQAVNQKLKAEIVYSGGSEYLSKRTIEPYRFFERLGNNYVESYCYLRQDFRTFRIDRIKSIEVINSPHEKGSASSPTYSSIHTSAPRFSATNGVPNWLWIVGFFLLLYFCSKFK
jgi:hypothetical protein